MEVSFDLLDRYFEKFPESRIYFDMSDQRLVNTFQVQKGHIDFQPYIDSEYIKKLKKRSVNRVSLCLTNKLFDEFYTLSEHNLPTYDFYENLASILERLSLIKEVNKYSKKHRKLILAQEIHSTDVQRPKLILPFGTEIEDPVIRQLNAKAHASDKFRFSYNERGVLLFVDDSKKNVTLRIDILALLSRLDVDIFFAASAEEARSIFDSKRPRLSIITHLEKSTESKDVFLHIYRNDPLANIVNYDESPAANRNEEITRVRMLYNTNYDENLESFKVEKNRDKPNLDGKNRNAIMDKIEHIRQNYNHRHFVEMNYYLYKVGKRFNVKTAETILNKIRE